MLYGVIYKITNKLNGKCYIGQTIQKNPLTRINCHFTKMKGTDLVYNSFLKHGRSNFKIEIIASVQNQDDLDFLENYFIKYFNTLRPLGFNLKSGGQSKWDLTEEIRDKMSKSQIKRFKEQGPAVKKGTKFTEEHKANMSKVRKGFTSENRKKAKEEWVKRKKENGEYSKLIAINIITQEELIFDSIQDCARALNLIGTCISRVLNGKQGRKQHNGYFFKKYVALKEQKV